MLVSAGKHACQSKTIHTTLYAPWPCCYCCYCYAAYTLLAAKYTLSRPGTHSPTMLCICCQCGSCLLDKNWLSAQQHSFNMRRLACGVHEIKQHICCGNSSGCGRTAARDLIARVMHAAQHGVAQIKWHEMQTGAAVSSCRSVSYWHDAMHIKC